MKHLNVTATVCASMDFAKSDMAMSVCITVSAFGRTSGDKQ